MLAAGALFVTVGADTMLLSVAARLACRQPLHLRHVGPGTGMVATDWFEVSPG